MAEIASILANRSDSARLRLLASQGNRAANDEVLAQFEALFLQQMLKSMRAASPGSGLLRSQQTAFYWHMYDQHMASELAARQALGIAAMINKQLGTGSVRPKPPAPIPAPVANGDRLNSNIINSKKLNSNKINNNKINSNNINSNNINSNNINSNNINSNNINSDRFSDAQTRAADSIRPLHAGQTGAGKFISADIASSDIDNSDIGKPEAALTRAQFFAPQSPQEFVALAYPYAHQPAEKLAVNAKVLVAIAALETGWGRHLPADKDGSSNNYFGIKADPRWPGKKVASQTLEFRHGIFNSLQQTFRAYATLKDSFNDFADFILSNQRYQKALAFTHDTQRFLQAMQQAGYATDPAYADKILKILDHSAFANIRR